MDRERKYFIIGSGSAGFGAARAIREHDDGAEISLVTLSSLPFYNRYDLPKVFRGVDDWRDLLAVPTQTYEELDIRLRRASRVVDVDGRARTLQFSHSEAVRYDRLLVCSGGAGFVPASLADFRHLLHGFGSFEQAIETRRAVPRGGTVILLGGDMIGLDLAYTLLDTGHEVILVTNEQTFWPHQPDEEERRELLEALVESGFRIIAGTRPVAIEDVGGRMPRRLVMEDGSTIAGHVVMAFCGLQPSVEFMLGAGVDIERGILVDTHLRSSNEWIWAAGDVCQIWSDADKQYKFYHGWKNVRIMGEIAARNMTGAEETFDDIEPLSIHVENGRIWSTFWEH